jgi:hypothetical protein
MTTFIINTKGEMLKCRKTAAYWLTLLAGAFMPFLAWLILVSKPENFTKKLKADPWRAFMNMNWEGVSAFLLPMYVILVTSLVVQIEYRNNSWKQVYASPRSYADIFFSKFVVINLLIVAALILFNLFMIISACGANAIHSGYTFFSTPIPWLEMLTLNAKMYVSILGVTAIQYWLSLRLRNYIASMGIGLALLITALIIMKWEHIQYFPYAYTVLTYYKDLGFTNDVHLTYSYIWFAVILVLAFLDTVKRKERG